MFGQKEIDKRHTFFHRLRPRQPNPVVHLERLWQKVVRSLLRLSLTRREVAQPGLHLRRIKARGKAA